MIVIGLVVRIISTIESFLYSITVSKLPAKKYTKCHFGRLRAITPSYNFDQRETFAMAALDLLIYIIIEVDTTRMLVIRSGNDMLSGFIRQQQTQSNDR